MNMKKMLSALVACMLVAGTAQAAGLEMNFQGAYSPAIVEWLKSIGTISKGEMKMHYFQPGSIVSSSTAFDGIRNGLLDAGSWTASEVKKTPYAYLGSLPYLAKDQAHAYRVFMKMYEELPEFRKDLEKAGVFLGLSVSGPIHIVAKDAPVHTPADVNGKRVLVTSGSFAEYVKAWGGIPVQVSLGDIYTSLERGMGDMFVCGVACVKSTSVQEFCKYSTSIGQTFSNVLPYSMNRDLFEADMVEEEQAVIMEASRELGRNVLNASMHEAESIYAKFREVGMEVYFPSEEEMKEWRGLAMGNIESQWHHRLKAAGVKDPEKWIKKFYDFAASVE